MPKSLNKKQYGMKSLLIIISMIVQALIFTSFTHAGTFTEVTGFGSNPGNMKMFKYVPNNMPAKSPLVVSLHGCTQTASAYSSNGWTALADEWKFYVLFPEQQRGNNPSLCFNWFERGDHIRGSGEAQAIRSMVEKMKSEGICPWNRSTKGRSVRRYWGTDQGEPAFRLCFGLTVASPTNTT